MRTTYSCLKIFFTLICGCIGGLFGAFGGIGSPIIGIISGSIVGFLYAHFTLNIKSSSKRVFLGAGYGILGGFISGGSVHTYADLFAGARKYYVLRRCIRSCIRICYRRNNRFNWRNFYGFCSEGI